MFPFWDVAIWPVLQAARAQRVVEIGALRGETTVLMLERLGPDTELHVIDPVPEFDPAEHEKRFPGRYLFHRDISHNVLPALPPVDVALIDGDHNWFTVFHELRMLAETARAAGAPLPVMVMHDVGWPYGRRDLYYAPERIPESDRQPYAMRGMLPGRKKLVAARGGLNPKMHNALEEGTPHNGVMTALDDFLAQYDRPVRKLVLPIYFGLAIVAEEAVLDARPELRAVLDHLESAAGKDELLEVAESTRLQSLIFQHNVFYHREEQLERAATRYLDLLAAALLNEHYLDHEARLRHLAECIDLQRPPDRQKLRDPRYMKHEIEQLETERRAGALDSTGFGTGGIAYTEMGRVRLDALRRLLDEVRTGNIEGDFVECSTGRGGGGIFLRGYLDAHELPGRQVWVADTFRARDLASSLLEPWTDLDAVRDGFARFGLLDDRVRFLQGPPADAFTDDPVDKVALLRLGPGLGEAAGDALEALYDRLAPGAVVVVDGEDDEACHAAVDDFRARHRIASRIERLDAASICWRRTDETLAPRSRLRDMLRRRAQGAPLARSVATREQKDLSVVVVFYNMRREAARTLQSLSRAYQQGVDDVDYEVVVVENGSRRDQRLGEEFVGSFGPEFKYLDIGKDATPSPAPALNRGLALANGRAVAFMIDGAHVLTPGVLQFGLKGLQAYDPAIVVTQQWYVGPGQQGDVMQSGYDQDYEDKLFTRIEWPTDGYRLFEIGHFIGDRDWLDGMWESNCIFVPRALLEQSGGFDEGFTTPGGGYANLDFYERMGCAPGVHVVTILGEGSFHQVHGGTTTNQPGADGRRDRITSFATQYAELRGRPFKGPGKTFHYVGTMRQPALRSRARRMTASAFIEGRVNDGPDGRPTKPTPIPEELTAQYVDAYWHSLGWRDTTWLGRRVQNSAADLIAYQQLLVRLRPDWIIETGAGNGGRAGFLASVCDLVGNGRVVSIDSRPPDDDVDHPRIERVVGYPHHDDVVEQVRDIVGDAPNALVVLGTLGSQKRMMAEFEAYHGFVPVGSYVIVEETIVNGHPVWPGFGPGPAEAVKQVLARHDNFAVDPRMEQLGVTFNPSGFLKRLR